MSEILLSVKDLVVQFSQGEKLNTVVHGLNFELRKGETLAIVGESGSGKSVSTQAILGLLPAETARIHRGSALFEGQNLISSSEDQLRSIRGNRIGMIFQEPMTSLNPLHTIEKQVAEPLLIHKGLSKTDAKQRVLELLTLVGIPSPKSRLQSYPHELSGGQKQRVMIAMALANEPDILIADEPTTALDVTVQKQVLELIKSLQEKLGMAVILISHDLNVVRRNAHNIVVMKAGHVMESGSTEQIFEQAKHPYTQTLINSEPSGSPSPVKDQAKTLISANQINVRFPLQKNFFGKVTKVLNAVDGISFSVKEGETLGIVGESGSGKTTLGMSLLKLQSYEGDFTFDETHPLSDLDQAGFKPYRKDIQVVFQDPFGSLSPRMSVQQIIAEGLEIHQPNLSREAVEEAVIDVLKQVELDAEARHRYPHEFSGGQRQRISIARALILKPRLIVLDEPTSALDRTVQMQVIELLRRLQKQLGLSYIFISHDLAVVKALSHRVMVMKSGQVVEEGSAEEIFTSPKQAYTADLVDAAFFYTN